ncbi:MAG: hypothetical protein NUV51_08700, partial [Sulfuricaulis sp.]|nr:hypothetical protein [Sulfuricaulis sp.]
IIQQTFRSVRMRYFIIGLAAILYFGAPAAFAAPSCAWPTPTSGVCVDDSGATYCVSCPDGKQSYACSRVACSDGKAVSQPPSQNATESAITSFYNNRGEWAGVFRMTGIEKIKVDTISATQVIANVRYSYAPIPGNYKKRTDSGYDQRTFVFNKNGPIWEVTSMGEHMSAKF